MTLSIGSLGVLLVLCAGAVVWSRSAFWVAGLGLALSVGATLWSWQAFGPQGEGWVFLLPSFILAPVFFVSLVSIAVRRTGRMNRAKPPRK